MCVYVCMSPLIVSLYYYLILSMSHYVNLIHPRRACAARVTVVVLSFRPSVCLLPRFLPLRATRRPISDTNGFSATLALFSKWYFFCKNAAFESYGVKQSEGANTQISTGLPRQLCIPWRHQKLQRRATIDSRLLSSNVASQ